MTDRYPPSSPLITVADVDDARRRLARFAAEPDHYLATAEAEVLERLVLAVRDDLAVTRDELEAGLVLAERERAWIDSVEGILSDAMRRDAPAPNLRSVPGASERLVEPRLERPSADLQLVTNRRVTGSR